MAKTKYCPEVVADIVAALETTGRDQDGWTAGKISYDTYYTWQKRHPEFSEKVAQAKRFYRDHIPAVIQRDATARLVAHLRNGHEEQWIRKEVVRDGSGKIIMTKETQSRVIRPVPNWVYDRIFGKNIQVIDAMQTLLAEGAALPEQAEIIKRNLDRMEQELKSLSARTITTDIVEEGQG